MIPHNRPTLGQAEAAAAASVIATGWVAQGKEVSQFENELCHFLGLDAGHAVAVSSGTAALYMALNALNLKQGKRVAIPVYACAALRNAVLMADADPYLQDVEVNMPLMDLPSVEEIDGAIIVHTFGIPKRLADETPIPLVEDCAQALGASIDGNPVGLQADVGVYSFYATKMITSGGQGGMLVSEDIALIDELRDYREFDCRDDVIPRFNFQMTDLQAAVGRVQLARLPEFIERRSSIVELYRNAGLPLWPDTKDAGLSPCHYRAVVDVDDPRALIDALEIEGIRGIIPIEDWELAGDKATYPRSLRLAHRLVSLPCYPSLSHLEAKKIVNVVSRYYERSNS